jgi:hypothetical protein
MSFPPFQVTGESGTFIDYTYTSSVYTWTGYHSHLLAHSVFFNAMDTNVHRFKITYTSMASPCDDIGYGTNAWGTEQTIDRDSNIYIDQSDLAPKPYSASPWIGTKVFTVQTGPNIYYYPGYPVWLVHLELANNVWWPTIGINDVLRGSAQIITHIESIDDSTPVTKYNRILMLIGQHK